MAESKFTPGPWGFQESEVYKNTWRITADGQRLASLDSDDGDPAQTQANAELMADAPRLLEVLRKVLEYSDIKTSWLTIDEAEHAFTQAHELLEKHGG
jgi:protein required for attachment to host cells